MADATQRDVRKPAETAIIRLESLTRDQLGEHYRQYSNAIDRLIDIACLQAVPGDNPQELTAQFQASQQAVAAVLKDASIGDPEQLAQKIVEFFKAVRAPEIVATIRQRVPEGNRAEYDGLVRQGLKSALLYALPGSVKSNFSVLFQKNERHLITFFDGLGFTDAENTANQIMNGYKAAVNYKETKGERLV